MKYNSNSLSDTSEGLKFKYFLLHEAFHEYYQVEKWKNIDQLNSFLYLTEWDSEQYQFLLMELGILDAIYFESDIEIQKGLIQDFLTIREHRYKLWPYMEEESRIETLEGTATYIEHKYANYINDTLLKENQKELLPWFLSDSLKQSINDDKLLGILNKDMYYTTGARLCLIMDRLDLSWKNSIDEGKTIYEVLKSHIDTSQSLSLEQIKEKYDFTLLKSTANEIVEALKK